MNSGTFDNPGEGQQRMVFCSVLYPTRSSELDGLLLVESIRAFAGDYSHYPIQIYAPGVETHLTKVTIEQLDSLNVPVFPIEVDCKQMRFFFMGTVTALAAAEAQCAGKYEYLVWMDANTIVLQEPADFTLPGGISLGYRPVHHMLVGSRFEQQMDPFWTAIYRACNVPSERVFPMKPHVEEINMRPYFNAGIMVTRPELGLFQSWHDAFLRTYQEPVFQELYRQDQRYGIFMHQAILSGLILAKYEKSQIMELPRTYNYPVHLYAEDRTCHRPHSLEDLVTFRHEGFYQDPDWYEKLPAGDELKCWLEERVSQI